ncbi:MAG: hypothetical protein KGI98_01920 [Euryarchaeota archaeon]|nr:hypothetical protein [Euryarchaeota archaeon]MDE1881182.1 hypothetical protein [Euryarchaeota archaeon]
MERRIEALPRAGLRHRVNASREKREEQVDELDRVIDGEGPVENVLGGWALGVGEILGPAET